MLSLSSLVNFYFYFFVWHTKTLHFYYLNACFRVLRSKRQTVQGSIEADEPCSGWKVRFSNLWHVAALFRIPKRMSIIPMATANASSGFVLNSSVILMHGVILKLLDPVVANSLRRIFNAWLLVWIFPQAMETGEISQAGHAPTGARQSIRVRYTKTTGRVNGQEFATSFTPI